MDKYICNRKCRNKLNLMETTKICLAETANSIDFQEINTSHISNNDTKTKLTGLITNYASNKIIYIYIVRYLLVHKFVDVSRQPTYQIH